MQNGNTPIFKGSPYCSPIYLSGILRAHRRGVQLELRPLRERCAAKRALMGCHIRRVRAEAHEHKPQVNLEGEGGKKVYPPVGLKVAWVSITTIWPVEKGELGSS